MIGTIDVKVQAHNPNFPLEPVFTFINSAQSFRIRNVPRAIGKWNITKVFIHLNYPDNTTVQKECVLNGNIWIGTVEGCATSGTSTNGFYVTASGIDENENVITNYVLGAGDLYVKDLDGTIEPAHNGEKMYFNDTLPTNPKKGDATFIDGVLNVYDGTNWTPVADDPDLSNYYTKTEVDEALGEVEDSIPTKTSDLTNDSGFITSADVPTKTSDLVNDSGFITSSALNVKRDLTDLNYVRALDYDNPERIVGFQEGVITYYTMFEKVSDTLYKWHKSNWNGQSANDYRIELSLENPAEPIFSYYRGNDELITSFTIPNGATSFSWEYQDYSTTHVLELLSEDTIALKNDFVSQFRNDCGYLTKTDVIPANGQYQGYADKAKTTAGIGASYPTNDPVVVPALADFSFVDALWDNTTGTILRAYTYERYPWVLSMLNGTTFDPPIPLNWGYWHVQRRIGSRLRTVWRGLGWMSDFVDGVAYLIGNTNSDGSTVDLHLTTLNGTTITSTYSSKAITLNQYETSIETYDGQPNSITCTRSTSNIRQKFVKYVAYTDELPTKTSDLTNDSDFITSADVPTKTSDLTNDSGFITLAQVPTPSYIEDATGNKISANLSCIYIDDTAWEMTDPSSNKHILEYVGFIQSYHTWECVEPESIKLVLTYANDWELQVYTWQEIGPGGDHDWVLDINASYDGDSDITTIPYFVNAQTTYNYSAQRPVTKHLTLATKEYVDSLFAQLNARISALENNNQ